MGRKRVNPLEGSGTDYIGVYSYRTTKAVKYRCAWQNSDKVWDGKKDFPTAYAAHEFRCRMVAEAAAGTQRSAARDAFGPSFLSWLANKRGRDIADGTADDYQNAYNRHLYLWAERPVRDVDMALIDDHVTDWLHAGLWSRKTIRNTLSALSSFFSDMVRTHVVPENPCKYVRRPTDGWIERDFLHIAEVDPYLDGCSALYRPLAETLIGTGTRISEALGLQLPDLEYLDQGYIFVERQVPLRKQADDALPAPTNRRRGRREVRPTKSRAKRSVAIGPNLAEMLAGRAAIVAELTPDTRSAYLFQMPPSLPRGQRGGTQTFPANTPMSRTTVSREWHWNALQDAGIVRLDGDGERIYDRDLPLHSTRHTAAALWLGAGNTMEFVRAQLGHSNIGTTQRYYAHLEMDFRREAAAAAERLIEDARKAAEVARRMPS